MALVMKVVLAGDLPPTASHGFKLTDPDEPRRLMFFHWNENTPIAESITGPPKTGIAPEGLQVHNPEEGPPPLASYADILKALPDRLAAMGFEDQTDEILAQVTERFGVGN